MATPSYLGGLDIGATKIVVVLADEEGRIVTREQENLQLAEGRFTRWREGTAYSGVAGQAIRLLERVIESVGEAKIDALGIGSAGPLAEGAIVDSTNIRPFHIPEDLPSSPLYIPLVEPIASRFGIPVILENDANAAVLGEVYFGAGKKVADKGSLHIVYVTLSTGLGAGVWSEGRLLKGKDGNAGEVGHFVVKGDGLRCGCGNVGCAEAYCSGRGIVGNARERLLENELSPALPLVKLAKSATREAGMKTEDPAQFLGFIDPPLVFRAAEAGDPIAQVVLRDAAYYGGVALAGIANAYDPELITVGGGIAIHQPQLVEAMRQEMVHHLNVRPPSVRVTRLGAHAVEMGAIALAGQVVAG